MLKCEKSHLGVIPLFQKMSHAPSQATLMRPPMQRPECAPPHFHVLCVATEMLNWCSSNVTGTQLTCILESKGALPNYRL